LSHLRERTYLRQKLRQNICVAGGSLRAGSLLLLLLFLLLRRGLRSEIVPPPQYPHHNRSRDKNRRSRTTSPDRSLARDSRLNPTSFSLQCSSHLFRSNRRREFSRSEQIGKSSDRELKSRREPRRDLIDITSRSLRKSRR